jgi:hypothetical protein
MAGAVMRRYRKRRRLPTVPRQRGLNKVEQKQTQVIAKKLLNRNQELKQRAWQINSTYNLDHNVPAILFGTVINGGLLELQQQGATVGQHLTTRPHPVTATPLNNAGYLREGNKVKCSSVHLNLCASTPIDRQGTKLRCIMFWFPINHSVVWSDLVAASAMGASYNNLLVPINRNSVCKIFMDKTYTLGAAGAGTAGGGNYPTTTMIKLRKTFKGGKSIEYDSDLASRSPEKWNIGFACVPYNFTGATTLDTVANFEYSGNMYFRDS